MYTYHDGGIQENMPHTRDILQDISQPKRSDDFDGLMEVLVTGDCNKVALVTTGVGHQPDAHLHDNP